MGLTPQDQLLEREIGDGLPEPFVLLLELLEALHLVCFQAALAIVLGPMADMARSLRQRS